MSRERGRARGETIDAAETAVGEVGPRELSRILGGWLDRNRPRAAGARRMRSARRRVPPRSSAKVRRAITAPLEAALRTGGWDEVEMVVLLLRMLGAAASLRRWVERERARGRARPRAE